jgi:hypothetical protein
MHWIVCVTMIFLSSLLLAKDDSKVPLTIKFSGTLETPSGDPKTGVTGVTFEIYDASIGGSPLWIETQNVYPDSSGRFTILLGTDTPLTPDIFASGEARWIEMVGSDIAAQDRAELVSVPYALKSFDAETLGGRPVSDFVLADQLNDLSLRSSSLTLLPTATAVVSGSSALHNTNEPAGPGFSSAFCCGLQDFAKGILLPAVPAGLAQQPQSSDSLSLEGSAPLDFQSAFLTGKQRSNQLFRWLSSFGSSATSSNPTPTLNLQYSGNNSNPTATGFSFNIDGTVNFAPGQQFPSGAVVAALNQSNDSGAGSTMSPTVESSTYSWTQDPTIVNSSPQGIQVGLNTVTLKPCPKGVTGKDIWHYLYISGTGTPEAVLITGGTCTSGAASGTIEFSAASTHPPGYSIGSATDGVQEAINDAIVGTQNFTGGVSRTVMIDPGTHKFMARLSIRASSITISNTGANIICMMTDTCIMLGDPTNPNEFSQIIVQGLRVSPGVQGGTWSAIEDNGQHDQIESLGTAPIAAPNASFGHLIQIDNDQAAVIDNLDTHLAGWARCDAQFCSSAIFGPGPASKNAGVLWVQNSDVSLQCSGNGIDDQDGNTLHISNSVVQGYPEFGIRAAARFGNTTVQLENVYQEVGNCVSPLGTGTAGLIVESGVASSTGGTGPAGKVPQFANTGTTQYNYYIIVHSSVMGVSPPFLAGTALTNGSGLIPVKWNEVGQVGTITYDVLRTVAIGATVPVYGSSNFAIATGVSTTNCTNSVCTINDDAAVTPSPYTVVAPTLYAPALPLWPGALILTSANDQLNQGGLVPTQYYAQTLSTVSIVNSDGAMQPSVFAQMCNPSGSFSPIWLECLEGNAVSNDNSTIIGTVLQMGAYGGNPGGLKGRLIFELPVNASLPATHVITLADSNPAKTVATPMNRPSWDSKDTYIGYDQPWNVPVDQTQLAFGAPTSISDYIANVGDGTNWLERLTANNKTFKVPVLAPSYGTTSNCISATGICSSASAGIITIPVGSVSTTVLTTAVTQKSEIHIDENTSYGSLLATTCDTSFGRHYQIRQQKSGTSFVVMTDSAPTANPACLSFSILN